MTSSGVYAIINLVNDQLYVGSAVNLEARWKRHIRELRKNAHCNCHLQAAFRLYGEHAFEFRVLEKTDPEGLMGREQFYIDRLSPEYNIALVVTAPMTGRKLTEEQRRKIGLKTGPALRAAHRHAPPHQRQAVAMANRLRVVTDETRAKMSEARRLYWARRQGGCR